MGCSIQEANYCATGGVDDAVVVAACGPPRLGEAGELVESAEEEGGV